ncbi:UV DNA damage repair endonuclease UvsE [Clostridium akagii]|uniref:UV DNA damage repair endonuclease UvsE n=1 Tax=Clostridium akagii TaxID=91623 RepID=UPI00047DA331|nr:UV DNA damage repair endonuclease UvsE [Clostridium akagii]
MLNYKIGYACSPISLQYRTSRSTILKNFTEEKFNECVNENLKDLKSILDWNIKNNIYFFRISSDIIPFGGHEVNNIKWWDTFKYELENIGNFINENDIRVSMHPGQYTVLNSTKESVVTKSILDLEYHCRFLDALKVDYTNKITLHLGGVYGDKPTAVKRFISGFNRLSPSLKKRLVLENDDKSYTIKDVIALCKILKIPAIFDNLHNKLNPCDLTLDEILSEVASTWTENDGAIKMHYSEQDANKKNGSHSKFVITKNFIEYLGQIHHLKVDIMLEVKDKELSALKCVNILNLHPSPSIKYSQWAKYKYSVMEKNYTNYKYCSKIVNSPNTMINIYEAIDQALLLPFSQGNFINTAEHVYGYVKKYTTMKEKEIFFNLLEEPLLNKDKIKLVLQRLCKKYGQNYINESYYFIY